MIDYLKYETKFDKNMFDLEHNKITIGEYDEKFRAMVDEIRADTREKAFTEAIAKLTEYKSKLSAIDWIIVNQCIEYLEQLKETEE